MKRSFFLFFLFFSVNVFSQEDVLSYQVTSKFSNGNVRSDKIEYVNGIVENAYYSDGIHYYWTKRYNVDGKEKELIEFSYLEEDNFNSDLTIKISKAEYSNVVYSGYGTTISNTYDTPKYKLDKTIKIFKDKVVCYEYFDGNLWTTYFCDKKGVIQYTMRQDYKSIYTIDGDKLIITGGFNNTTRNYVIGDDVIARRVKEEISSFPFGNMDTEKYQIYIPLNKKIN